MNYHYFTSESVAAGHPDKICDQISDSIVDAALKAYPKSRVAAETLVTKDQIVLAGEVAHRLVEKMDEVRVKRILPYLRPDGKSEVMLKYQNGKPVCVTQVVLAVPCDPKIENEKLKKDLTEKVV